MGNPVFDRQVFVKKSQTQKPPSRSPLPGAFILLLVAGLSAFATYRYVKAGGTFPPNSADSADKAKIAELQGKLKAMQDHVNELEKRRHAAPEQHVPAKTVGPVVAKPATSETTLLAEPVPHVAKPVTPEPPRPSRAVDGNADHSASAKVISVPPVKASPPLVKSVPQAPAKGSQNVPNKELTALQGNIAASHDEWQAATDRLGNVVGELDSQRSEIQKTQTGVNYLLERVQNSDVSFTLNKGSGLQRVGPISMQLESTSVRGQHYNIRMMVDDKSVELKDRALNEIVQFYTSRSKYPLRLIVSQIGRGQVSGTLAVPSGLSKEMNNTHLQER
jgi:hypothetical protein